MEKAAETGAAAEEVRVAAGQVAAKAEEMVAEGMVQAAEEEENTNHQFTHGAGSTAQAAAKKQKLEDARKNTRAEKQLAKVNKKGMKSMMSFFGAPKKKS